MSELVERLRSEENQAEHPDAVAHSLQLVLEYSAQLTEANKDISGIIERRAGEIQEIYADVDTSDVSDRETALLYAYGQLAMWVMDSTGSVQQRRDDLLRRLDAVDEQQ